MPDPIEFTEPDNLNPDLHFYMNYKEPQDRKTKEAHMNYKEAYLEAAKEVKVLASALSESEMKNYMLKSQIVSTESITKRCVLIFKELNLAVPAIDNTERLLDTMFGILITRIKSDEVDEIAE